MRSLVDASGVFDREVGLAGRGRGVCFVDEGRDCELPFGVRRDDEPTTGRISSAEKFQNT